MAFWLADGILSAMHIRPATVKDVDIMNALIADFAGQDRMLFRPPSDIYESLQTFLVAEEGEKLLGCCALEVIWADLAEIKSLAVAAQAQGRGIGAALIEEAVSMAKRLGVPKVFALTMEPIFFEKRGFETVEKNFFPMKVWSDCARCPKQDHCDEVAVIRVVSG
ncbi:N-acetyltransferase [Planctomycetota bacterium]